MRTQGWRRRADARGTRGARPAEPERPASAGIGNRAGRAISRGAWRRAADSAGENGPWGHWTSWVRREPRAFYQGSRAGPSGRPSRHHGPNGPQRCGNPGVAGRIGRGRGRGRGRDRGEGGPSRAARASPCRATRAARAVPIPLRPEIDRAPAVAGEGSIDCARCGQPPMRNIFVPQTGQVPWVAGLPFFIVIFCASFMSRFALHFTQYASATPGASLSSRWTSSGPSPGARPLRSIQVRRSHLVRIRRTQQIRGGANSRNGSPRRIGASSRFPRDRAG